MKRNNIVKDMCLIIASFIISIVLGVILQLKITSNWAVWHIVVGWVMWLTISLGTCVSLVWNARK